MFWKISTAVLLSVVAWLTYHTYTEHRQLTKLSEMLHWEPLNTAGFRAKANQVLEATEAKVAVLWIANIQSNSRVVVYAADKSGTIPELIGYHAPLFTESSIPATHMARLADGVLRCNEINTRSKVGLYVASVGAPNICRIGLVKNGQLIGYISLSFPESLSLDEVQNLQPLVDELIRAARNE